MSAAIVAAVAVAAATCGLLVVLAQPGRAWCDAAEHRRAFWVGWELAAMVVGGIGLVVAGPGWAGAGWITFWCIVSSLRPAMIADLRDVRRLVRRAARVPPEVPSPEPALPPIRWHTRRPVAGASKRLATAGQQRFGA